MPNDTPSPLALAREAAETAREEFWATRLRQAQVGSAVYPPAHNRLQQAREKMDRAIRAEREALVEATLRWATTMDAYIEQEGSAVVALGLDGEEFTVAHAILKRSLDYPSDDLASRWREWRARRQAIREVTR